MTASIQIPFTNEVIANNRVIDVIQTDGRLWIDVEPHRAHRYERPDAGQPDAVEVYRTDIISVQELGLLGQKVRYQVHVKRVRYSNAAGEIKRFTLDVRGVNLRMGLTDGVIEKALYFLIDRNESLEETVILLRDLYGVETSTSALDRLKRREADGLPSSGELIQMLHVTQPIAQLHIDEYRATGKRGWELVLRDEHGRLLVVRYLRRRSERKLRAVLRWLRMLGLDIQVCYGDGWAAYLGAIAAIFPQAKVQYDYFHIIQNIWRHLYKAFTAYRKAFKLAKSDKARQKVRDEMHKRLWRYRYLFFTRPEHLDTEDKQRLQDLLADHRDSILHQIVAFTRRIWQLFENSPKKLTAHLKRLDLVAEGWSSLSDHFAQAMRFLTDNFKQMITFIDDPQVQRNSLAETTVRMLRPVEAVRQGFKSAKGRAAHFKLWIFRRYLRPLAA